MLFGEAETDTCLAVPALDDRAKPLAMVLLDQGLLQLPGDYFDRGGSLLLAVGAAEGRKVRQGDATAVQEQLEQVNNLLLD